MAKKTKELITIPITVDVPYTFAAGRYMTKFFMELKENGKIWGVKCPKCGRVQLPPRIVCAPCHVKNQKWVEISDEGTLVAFTIMYIPLTDPTTGKPHNPPFVYGSVRLDGATSVIDHFVKVEPDGDKIWVGMRCKLVMRPQEQRTGDLSDFLHIEPLPGQQKPKSIAK